MLLSVTSNVRPDADQMTKVRVFPPCWISSALHYFFKYQYSLRITIHVVRPWRRVTFHCICVCSDSLFWWCRSDDSSVLRLAFPAGQLAEVSVLQRPPESSAQVAQGKNQMCFSAKFAVLNQNVFNVNRVDLEGVFFQGEWGWGFSLHWPFILRPETSRLLSFRRSFLALCGTWQCLSSSRAHVNR